MAAPRADIKRIAVTRHIIYALLTVAIIVPMLRPTPCSFQPTPNSRRFHERIEQLPAGSEVLLSFDYSPDAKAELYPMSVTLLEQCFERGLIPVVMTHWPEGVRLAEQACHDVAKKYGKESGKDYVLLGFKPGGGNLLLNMGENFKSAFPEDYYHQPTATMAALKGVKTLRDIDLAVDLAAGPTVDMWVVYGSDRYGFPLAAGTTAVAAPKCYPYLQSGQLKGLLGGMRGAADYEQLVVKGVGPAGKLMLPQTVAHLLLIVLLVLANGRFTLARLRGKEGT